MTIQIQKAVLAGSNQLAGATFAFDQVRGAFSPKQELTLLPGKGNSSSTSTSLDAIFMQPERQIGKTTSQEIAEAEVSNKSGSDDLRYRKEHSDLFTISVDNISEEGVSKKTQALDKIQKVLNDPKASLEDKVDAFHALYDYFATLNYTVKGETDLQLRAREIALRFIQKLNRDGALYDQFEALYDKKYGFQTEVNGHQLSHNLFHVADSLQRGPVVTALEATLN
jgi:hypothetical protein